ncbi:dapdiamide synthesis protein DdaC-like [Glandiceps talaboti]
MAGKYTLLQIVNTSRRYTFADARRRLLSSNAADFVFHERYKVPSQSLARVAGRKWLPGSTSSDHNLPEYLAHPKDYMPAVYEAIDGKSTLESWAEKTRRVLDCKLHVFGTILFRGLPIANAEDLSQFLKALQYPPMYYDGGSGSRHEVSEYIMTANDSDPTPFSIEPHNEMSYTNHYPHKLFFFCDIPVQPGCGGENVIAYNKDILSNLDPGVVRKFEKLGLKYNNHVESRNTVPDSYFNWQTAFRTEDKLAVEKYLNEQECMFEWEHDDSITYWRYIPAFRNHPKTGVKVWFNAVSGHHASYFYDHPSMSHVRLPTNRYPYHTFYGDGSEIEPEVLQHIRDVIWQVAVGFCMQKNDLLVFDNLYAQHGRLGFTCDRRLLVAMTRE